MRGREDGYVLAVVLVFAAALMVLLAAFGPLSVANMNQAVRQERETQAHYLARSGASALASAIMDNPGLAEELLQQGDAGSGQLGAGNFSVELEELDEDRIVIHSTGTVRGEDSRVSLVLNRVDADYMERIFDRAIFCSSDLDISHNNTQIHGSVESTGRIIGNPYGYPHSGYEKIEYSNRSYPPPLFPGDIERNNNVWDIGNSTGWLYDDAYYKTISIGPNGTLKVDTGTGESSRIVRLVVEKLECKGYLEVTGEGRLLLFVINEAELQTPHGYIDGSERRLITFLNDGATFQIIANSNFAGYVYGPGASVGIQSHGTVYGAIIGKNVVRMVGTGQSVHGKVFFEDLMEEDDLARYFKSKSKYSIGYWIR